MLKHIHDEDELSYYMLSFLLILNTCGGYDDIN